MRIYKLAKAFYIANLPVLATIAIGIFCASQVRADMVAHYLAFNDRTAKCDSTTAIYYKLPDPIKFGRGPYPVFMYTTGTFDDASGGESTFFTDGMAARGFLAASVGYANKQAADGCGAYQNKSSCIYDDSNPSSATHTLCSLPKADCSKGIVTAGFSQGAAIAVLAANYSSKVQATYAMTLSDFQQQAQVALPCLDKSNTAIPANRLVVVTGESDSVFGGQTPLENVSGFSCPAGSIQCKAPDQTGAGWVIVQDSDVKDKSADHCYFLNGGCVLGAISPHYDPSWAPPARFNWSLDPNLDWLASKVAK